VGYKLSSNYRWYLIPKEPIILARVYYIEGIPFDLDEINKEENLQAINEANSQMSLKADDLFKYSDYLISEMVHPMPKKEYIEFFEFSDEGYTEARIFEDSLIAPVYNTDPLCLNEHCGGVISLEVLRKNYELGTPKKK
jgi:hypothetical protein